MANRKAGYNQRAIFRGKIRKLQKAGLVGDVDFRKKPSARLRELTYKYRDIISGKAAAVKLSTAAKAADYRERIGQGGRGKIVIVPRERGEKFTVTKDDTIKSVRTAYGQKVEKTVGDKFSPPGPGEKVYYTIPRRRRGTGQLKRHTFASFDEMLFYLTKYEIDFDDIEDFIEVERFREGSRRQKSVAKDLTAERARALKKRKYRKGKKRKR